jgi:hypothetical protein
LWKEFLFQIQIELANSANNNLECSNKNKDKRTTVINYLMKKKDLFDKTNKMKSKPNTKDSPNTHHEWNDIA